MSADYQRMQVIVNMIYAVYISHVKYCVAVWSA